MSLGRYMLAISLLYVASATAPVLAADDSDGKAVTVFIKAGQADPEVSKEEKKRNDNEERKRIKEELETFLKDAKIWWKGLEKAHGKDFKKWPASVDPEIESKFSRLVALRQAEFWAFVGTQAQKDLDDSTKDIKNGIAGKSFFASKKDKIELVETPEAAQLVVEVLARRKVGISGQYVSRFIAYKVSAGGQLPAEVFAAFFPGGAGQGFKLSYNVGNFRILSTATQEQPFWIFVTRSGDMWSTTGNMIGKHLSEMIDFNSALLMTRKMPDEKSKPEIDYKKEFGF